MTFDLLNDTRRPPHTQKKMPNALEERHGVGGKGYHWGHKETAASALQWGMVPRPPANCDLSLRNSDQVSGRKSMNGELEFPPMFESQPRNP